MKITGTLLLISLIFQVNTMAKQKPTVYIIGDSTVKNGKGDGAGGLWGWGEPIVSYFDLSKVQVKNRALGGTSSRTFQTRGLWQAVLDSIKKGDFVLMQFGHNDSSPVNDDSRARGTLKGVGEETETIDNLLTSKPEIVHSYGWYMRKMVRETKEKGATPILVTPIPRNVWENGKIKQAAESYPEWAIRIALEEKVQCIDLNGLMKIKLEKLGESASTGSLFLATDHTHTTLAGAQLAAKSVVELIRKNKKPGLKKFLAAEKVIGIK